MIRRSAPPLAARFAHPILLSIGMAMLSTIASAETIEGRLSTGLEDLSLTDAGPIVIYVVTEQTAAPSPNAARLARLPIAVVRQRGAKFEPRFLVVTTGQDVEMPNDDVIFHNVFSYSEPNEFDLGLYASGKSKTIRFAHPGLVRIYCSIHEGMDGLIFVSPSDRFAMPDADGRFAIRGVPVGRYRVHVWSERLPEIVVPVEVSEGTSVALEIELTPSDPGA